MLEVVLLVLKIAGIILAVILGILIVAACVVLLVPVRYRGDFSVSDAAQGKGKDIGVLLRAAWFLRLVRVYVSYEESIRVRVKLLFFTLMDTAKERKIRKKKALEDEVEKEQKQEENKADEEIKSEEAKADAGERAEKSKPEPDGNRADAEDDPKDGNNESSCQKEDQEQEKNGIKSRIYNILQTIRDFCDKLKGIKQKAEKIEELWISDHMIRSRSLLGKQLGYLLKHTRPKKLEGYLRFGFEDPATTGYAMALYGILYPLWSPKLSVEPDFEKQILDCHILIKGKIRAWHFVRVALRLIFSKDVRDVIKDVKKL
ncbi:MAG: DUF2953 domain-containing protein [Lachnospiraceae bacterium]|nr:DUF2953 domain-containing protein [Lachnospiraceae bacterium]